MPEVSSVRPWGLLRAHQPPGPATLEITKRKVSLLKDPSPLYTLSPFPPTRIQRKGQSPSRSGGDRPDKHPTPTLTRTPKGRLKVLYPDRETGLRHRQSSGRVTGVERTTCFGSHPPLESSLLHLKVLPRTRRLPRVLRPPVPGQVSYDLSDGPRTTPTPFPDSVVTDGPEETRGADGPDPVTDPPITGTRSGHGESRKDWRLQLQELGGRGDGRRSSKAGTCLVHRIPRHSGPH